MKLELHDLVEKAPEVAVDLDKVVTRRYGRFLEDFTEGEVYAHPRGLTVTKSFALDFATTFFETNPLYLNDDFARDHGFEGLLVSPMLILNLALSMGVQNNSEACIANLGYYNVKFLRPVYPGVTLRSYTKVQEVRDRGEGKPGIVTLRTLAVQSGGQPVIQYDRKIMVARSGEKSQPSTKVLKELPIWQDVPELELPKVHEYPRDLTGTQTYYGDFKLDQIFVHGNGRTMTDEHFAWTYKLLNTHPLHYDAVYSGSRGGKMSGDPIIYGGLLIAWLCGLASRDVSENALWDLGYTEGYHTQPTVTGDTVYAISRVLDKEDFSDELGIVTMQMLGVKNVQPQSLLDKHGEELFIKEGAKKKLGKEKIPEKIFEIERRLLIKK